MDRGDVAMNRVPASAALILVIVTLAALVLAIVAGAVGAVAAVYLYDRGTSKGNDLAVALVGFHAMGTFAFVNVFTLLWSRKRNISWRTPAACLVACLCALALTTALFVSSYDEYYAPFFLVAWAAVAAAGMAACVTSGWIRLRARHQFGSGPDRGDSL